MNIFSVDNRLDLGLPSRPNPEIALLPRKLMHRPAPSVRVVQQEKRGSAQPQSLARAESPDPNPRVSLDGVSGVPNWSAQAQTLPETHNVPKVPSPRECPGSAQPQSISTRRGWGGSKQKSSSCCFCMALRTLEASPVVQRK